METITGTDLARHVGVSPAYISRLLKNNLIPHVVIGKSRYPLWDCVDIMDRKCNGTACLEYAREIVGYSIKDAVEWANRIGAEFSDNCWWITEQQLDDEKKRIDELCIKKTNKPHRRNG